MKPEVEKVFNELIAEKGAKSLANLARMAGVSTATLQAYTKGLQSPQSSTFYRMVENLGLTGEQRRQLAAALNFADVPNPNQPGMILRQARGQTATQKVADTLGCTVEEINRYERDIVRPSADKFLMMLGALGLSDFDDLTHRLTEAAGYDEHEGSYIGNTFSSPNLSESERLIAGARLGRMLISRFTHDIQHLVDIAHHEHDPNEGVLREALEHLNTLFQCLSYVS